MTEIFKSDRSAAELEAQSIKSDVNETVCEAPERQTNLDVMKQLLTLCETINSCNSSYIDMVNNHSDSILKVQDENENIDEELTEKMGVQ